MNPFAQCCFWFITVLLSSFYVIALIAACIDGARRIALKHEKNRCRLCNCMRW